MKTVQISAEDIAAIIYSILHGDDSGFEEVLENGFNEIDEFADALRESERVFTVRTGSL